MSNCWMSNILALFYLLLFSIKVRFSLLGIHSLLLCPFDCVILQREQGAIKGLMWSLLFISMAAVLMG